MNEWTDGWMDVWMGGWIDGWMGGCMAQTGPVRQFRVLPGTKKKRLAQTGSQSDLRVPEMGCTGPLGGYAGPRGGYFGPVGG